MSNSFCLVLAPSPGARFSPSMSRSISNCTTLNVPLSCLEGFLKTVCYNDYQRT